MRTNSARTLSLFIVTVLCHTASAQQLLLQPVFSDDFSEDSRGDYEPQGDILWEAGKLTLSDGASLERTFKGGPWTRMEVEFESGNGTANAESAEVRLWLRLAGAPDCIVCLDQQDKQTERGFDKVALKRASDGSADAVPRLIRESNLEADVQRLTIDYRHGVARIGSGDSVVLSAYFEDGATAITGLRIEALGAPTRMNALSIMAAPPPPKLTASQKAALEKASALNARMMEFFRSGNFSEAVETAEDVLEITEATVGSQHPDYAVSLNNLAAMLWQAGESVRAESLYEQSLEITRELLGPHHPEYAMGLSNLGGLYGRKGDYERALNLVQQSVNIRKAAFGEENDEYAISISNLAMIHSDLGNYNHAAALYRRASDIFKSVLGERHPHYATSLLNLATSMGDLGDHTEARRLLERSLEVRESTLGKEHPAYAASLHNLATHYQMMGEYRTAEPLFQEALRLKLAALGDQHPEYAVSLKKLGRLYNETGDFAQAEMLYRQASKIDVKRFGTEHPTYAAYLNNLALLLKNQGKFDQAEPLYQQASSITRNALGTQHRSYATSLHNLATLYGDMGQLDQAMRLAEESLAIRESVLGEQHPDYALSLQTLGKLHQLRGEYNTARPLHQRAMEIRQAVYGEQHASIADCLKCLAGVFDGTGQHADAEPLHREALALHRRLLNSNAAVQSIRQQIRNQEEGRVYLDARLSSATLMDSTDPAGVAEDLWQWKGAVSMRQRAYRQVAANDEVAPLLADLQSVNRQLSALSSKTPVPPPTSASKTAQTSYTQRRAVWEAGFAELNREREALEKRIASGSDGFRRILQPLLPSRVQQLLPAGTAFVDFFEYNQQITDLQQPSEERSERRFIAVVVRPDGDPALVRLGSARKLSAAVRAFRRAFEPLQDSEEPRKDAVANALRESLWLPIERQLTGIDTVIISPDTTLGTMPFSAMPGREPGSYLIEDYRISLLPMAGLMQSFFDDSERTNNKGLLLVGDVNYDKTSGDIPSEPQSSMLVAEVQQLRSGQGKWESLSGFRAEMESVRSLHQQHFAGTSTSHILNHGNATEAAFLQQAPQYGNLHVITHGYFENPEVKSISQAASASGNLSSQRSADPFLNTYLPGLLSGLVMAGANNPSDDPEDPRDGILRASEIEASSMQGVDLVVLSACETGLGAVAGGEGLTGLQRAFHIAGARSVIASLWKVDDRATQILMERFYTNLWQKKMSKIDALREAQLWMLRHPQELEELGVTGAATRGLGGRTQQVDPTKKSVGSVDRTDPFFWAAFQLSGDWR